MSLELFHMSCRRKLVTLNRTWSLISVITSTEKNTISRRKSQLWAVVMSKFSWILGTIKFYFFENPLSTRTDHTESIYCIVITYSNRWISNSFNTGFLWTWRIHQSFSTILHSNPICYDNSIYSAGNNDIVLFTPSQTFNFAWMTRKSHSLRVFSCVKFKNMQLISRCCCKVLTTIRKFNIRTVFKWIYVLKITERFTIFLNI